MIEKSTFDFLKKLNKNNNRDWFNNHKHLYLAALDNFKAEVGVLLPEIEKFDPRVIGTEVKDCVFRIYRDIRFSKDKTPYKTYFGAGLGPGGRKAVLGEYYFHLEPGNSALAGGMWNPQKEKIQKIRQEIDYNYEEFHGIVTSRAFKRYFNELDSWGQKLKRPPKGYDAENPAINYLKHKHFIAVHSFTDAEILGKDFANKFIEVAKAMLPLNQFLDRAVED